MCSNAVESPSKPDLLKARKVILALLHIWSLTNLKSYDTLLGILVAVLLELMVKSLKGSMHS